MALRIRPSWFEGTSRGWMGLPDTAPEPRMNALWIDENQWVWVFGLRPAANWEEAWAHVGPLEGRTELTGASRPHYEKMFATEIEVIDPGRAARVAVLTFDRMIEGSLGDGRVWTLARDEMDRFSIDLWEIALITSGG